jgi:hypothetical protein
MLNLAVVKDNSVFLKNAKPFSTIFETTMHETILPLSSIFASANHDEKELFR